VDAPLIEKPEASLFLEHTVALGPERQAAEIQPQMKLLLNGLRQAANFPMAQEYVDELTESLAYLRKPKPSASLPRALAPGSPAEVLRPVLASHLADCQRRAQNIRRDPAGDRPRPRGRASSQRRTQFTSRPGVEALRGRLCPIHHARLAGRAFIFFARLHRISSLKGNIRAKSGPGFAWSTRRLRNRCIPVFPWRESPL